MPDVTTIGGAADAGVKLAEYGPTGVAIASLAILAFIAWQHSRDMRAASKAAQDAVKAQAEEHARAMEQQTATVTQVVERNTQAMTKMAETTAALSASLPHVCKYNRG